MDDGQCLHSDLFAGGDQALDSESASTGVLSSSMLVSKCLIKLDNRGKGTKKFTNQIIIIIHAVTVESSKESIEAVSPHKEQDDTIRRRC